MDGIRDGEVVHDYNYWGYHVYILVIDDLADEHPITVGYTAGNLEGLIIAMPRGKWDALTALDSQQIFLSTTRILAQTYIVNKLVRFN